MQQDWQPEAEQGGMYQLVGADYEIDADAKSVSGTLVAQGVDTGVRIEVRPGGPNVGFQAVADLMYLDTDILIGVANTDGAIAAQVAGRPLVALASQMTLSPSVYLWDPATYPQAQTVADVAASGATLLTSGTLFPSVLAGAGIVTMDQVDTSYQGSPDRFVTDPTIMQQGFSTNEAYALEHEVAQWMKPVAFQYLHEIGYSIYPEPIAVRAADVEAQAPCLERLVPILQQSQIDYLAAPEATNALLVELVETYDTSWAYSAEIAAYSAATQLVDGLVTDDPASGVFGQIDGERVAETVARFTPELIASGRIEEGSQVDAEALYDNRFIDPTISIAPLLAASATAASPTAASPTSASDS